MAQCQEVAVGWADPHLSYLHIIHLADTVLNIGAAAVPAGCENHGGEVREMHRLCLMHSFNV